jgi:hypothetical protein
VNYSSLLNCPVRSPKGSYTPLEELLLKLKVVSEINGRDRLFQNGRILKKFDEIENKKEELYRNGIENGDAGRDGGKGRNITVNITENAMENTMEFENENENENGNETEKGEVEKNEFQGKSVNGGFKRTRSDDSYSIITAPALTPSSSTSSSIALDENKRLSIFTNPISKAVGILKNKLSSGKIKYLNTLSNFSFYFVLIYFILFYFILFYFILVFFIYAQVSYFYFYYYYSVLLISRCYIMLFNASDYHHIAQLCISILDHDLYLSYAVMLIYPIYPSFDQPHIMSSCFLTFNLS